MSARSSLVVGLLPLIALTIFAAWFVQSGRSATSQAAAKQAESPPIPVAKPKAVVVDGVYDLGVLNPGDQRKHKFVVRNEGTADLTLELGSTSCKCTLAELSNVRIPPGGSDTVALEWHAEDPQFRFRQGATINTNDPALPTFELVGEGTVRVKLGTLPETAYLAEVPRNTLRTLNLLLYSQAFSEVTIKKIESSTPAIRAALATEVPQTSPPPETRFLRDLVVTVEPQTQSGHFEGLLRLDYVGRLPSGVEETGVYELPVSFDVVGDFSLHGRDVIGKVLMFGSVSQAIGAKKQAYIHIRSETDDDLRLSFLRAKPDFLKVQVGEVQRITPTIVRIPVTVEVPAEAPSSSFTEANVGEIELVTSRADRPTVRFSVSLVVVP